MEQQKAIPRLSIRAYINFNAITAITSEPQDASSVWFRHCDSSNESQGRRFQGDLEHRNFYAAREETYSSNYKEKPTIRSLAFQDQRLEIKIWTFRKQKY